MFDPAVAQRHLGRTDPVMRALIRALGPYGLRRLRGTTPYQTLVRAVAHQQLHGVAAETILGRLSALTPGPGYPSPPQLLALPEGALRKVGFSHAKALALRDIAEKTLTGVIPTGRSLARLADEAAIERLTEVRGVGRWTAEILLLRAGRPDILPVDDFGLRNGFRIAYRRRQMPLPRQLLAFGERWRPYRSVAAWYLWRAADQARAAAAATAANKRVAAATAAEKTRGRS